jgi:Pyridoxamine 5'-phosphate oxidase
MTMDVAEIFADRTTRELIERAPLMRLAYSAPDGSPRVIPTGYLERDATLIMYTIPTSAKVTALRADPRVAVTIDVAGMPPCALLVRGTCAIEIVDGIPEGYLEAGRRTMDGAAFAQWEAGVRRLYDSMAVLTITPTWAKLLDFERTVPAEVERLVRARGMS